MIFRDMVSRKLFCKFENLVQKLAFCSDVKVKYIAFGKYQVLNTFYRT